MLQDLDKLQKIYKSVHDIDLIVGATLEIHHPHAKMGPTFLKIFEEQFKRWKVGDRFWYENKGQFKPGIYFYERKYCYNFTIIHLLSRTKYFFVEQLREIQKMTVPKMMCESGDDITEVVRNAFLLPHPIR